MKTLTCDVCKKDISQPEAGRNYFHLAHRELCESCKNQLELSLKPVIRTKQPFTYEWYDRLMNDSIEKAIQTGKFESR
ncbi:MAG: hypothetical protein LBP71_06910 [Spirochaetaceae bacterium]|jgi:hypothetical protein|nr:hypothetical protein [Spirochaetaceae bacterium]